jgi:hypothetical protein
MSAAFVEVLIAAAVFLGIVLSLELGFRFGLRANRSGDTGTGQLVGVIEAAVLGLLGLLLAFSFAAAASRFFERQDLITQEANAIGTAWLRADVLDDAHRVSLRNALKEYTEHRVAALPNMGHRWNEDVMAEVARFHDRMWKAASEGVRDRPNVANVMLPAVNEVIDLHSTRVAAAYKHLPAAVTALLIVCSLLATGMIGIGCGMEGRRRPAMTFPLAFLIASALCLTIDLDHPRHGILQLNDTPLTSLKFGPP